MLWIHMTWIYTSVNTVYLQYKSIAVVVYLVYTCNTVCGSLCCLLSSSLCILMHETIKWCTSSLQLYDLMTMAFKYQVLLCPRPKDILLVSFNHMDAIKDFVKDTPSILSQVDETYRQLIEVRQVWLNTFDGDRLQHHTLAAVCWLRFWLLGNHKWSVWWNANMHHNLCSVHSL